MKLTGKQKNRRLNNMLINAIYKGDIDKIDEIFDNPSFVPNMNSNNPLMVSIQAGNYEVYKVIKSYIGDYGYTKERLLKEFVNFLPFNSIWDFKNEIINYSYGNENYLKKLIMNKGHYDLIYLIEKDSMFKNINISFTNYEFAKILLKRGSEEFKNLIKDNKPKFKYAEKKSLLKTAIRYGNVENVKSLIDNVEYSMKIIKSCYPVENEKINNFLDLQIKSKKIENF